MCLKVCYDSSHEEKQFTTKQSLTDHTGRDIGEYLYSCSQCQKGFLTVTALSAHVNIHTSKYKCTECGKCCESSGVLAVHRRSHSGQKPFECTVCSKRFTTSGSLVRHSRIHTGKYMCTECGKCCESSHHLAVHKRHTGEYLYSCSQCQRRFLTGTALSAHVNIHTGKYKCTECGRCCESSSVLAVHKRSHSGEKQYSCTQCGKSFSSPQSLTDHTGRHTGEYLYSCTQCQRRFLTATALSAHMNIHTGKYKCTECGRCCKSSSDLAVHRRSHSGQKPFECTVCSKRFTKSSQVKSSNSLMKHWQTQYFTQFTK